MKLINTIEWQEPLDWLVRIPQEETHFAMLYSGMDVGYSGRYSIFAFDIKKIINSDNFLELEQNLECNSSTYQNSWFGYLSYELLHNLEKLPELQNSEFMNKAAMPKLMMAQYKNIIEFDHKKKIIRIFSENTELPTWAYQENTSNKITQKHNCTNLKSNLSKEEYIDKIQNIINDIKSGILSQVNLTRKFFGSFKHSPDAKQIFKKLTSLSPAPYSAIIRADDNYVISSSPERFLKIDTDGTCNSRPIKGSAPRDKNNDSTDIKSLKHSIKDRAENLMIVDLTRNDMARTAEIGSVKVSSLYDIHSYENIHHMSSSIICTKNKKYNSLDMVKACFPPGSMTGAPKIKAIEIAGEYEKMARGIYSGAIGWFGGDGSADLSVTIRTIILNGKNFEFQVGGAIVADSESESEWLETMTKAKAMASSIGIELNSLKIL